MITIYALRDPRTWEVRYIGKTAYSVGERLCKHINLALRGHRDHKYNWLRQLLAAGLEPVLGILEELPPEGDWEEAEAWWIAEGRKRGWPLTNQTDGGGGVRPTEEVRAKMRAAWVERRKQGVSPETRARMSASKKGKKHSVAWVETQRQTLLGRSLSVATKAKIRAAQLGEKSHCAKLNDNEVREIRRRYAAGGVLQQELANEYGVADCTVSQIVNCKTWGHVR